MPRAMIAMSGGVDSSVAAAMLVHQGFDVVGVHMKLHSENHIAPPDVTLTSAVAPPSTSRTCCGLDDAQDARRVAEGLGIPFFVIDLEEAFHRAVVDDLVSEYVAGRTPNPCVQCNGVLKFRVLLARALALGCDHLATGHYCRVDPSGQALRMAADRNKDQSYFLWPLHPRALAHTLFPLGDLTKEQVRAEAHRLGLITATKPESMDICFLPDGDHARLIREQRPDLDGGGDLVDEQGHVLGHHDGYWRYTVGQRQGLGIALGFPAYVVRIEPETRRVVVAGSSRLAHTGLRATGSSWFRQPADGARAHVRIRHRGPLIPCTVHPQAGGGVEAHLLGPARAVTAGQSAVFYDGETLLGGATISAALS